MTIPPLSEATIRQQATARSFRRGENYYHGGAVISLARRGNVLEAAVEGSHYEPYRVRVTFDTGGVTDAVCDWAHSTTGGGGKGKQIVESPIDPVQA
jgi:uncharacterized Zn finger protein